MSDIYIDLNNYTIDVAVDTNIPGANGSPGVFVGPTAPADTTLLWVDTSIA
ncbi:hypothetical protein UFOVP1246_55 [uncultured Caudovirales phage]|uniref:Uncharacterized protein n=1 Tax=uncultured Caudovirales phage TaxID=2100421 RepID=A0A6J5R8B7_9CAUD|nr:hypothetical protein UFOVP1246_55 [uncultured Caudovirales phage]